MQDRITAFIFRLAAYFTEVRPGPICLQRRSFGNCWCDCSLQLHYIV